MSRPKCLAYVPVKMPAELLEDLKAEADRRRPSASVSDVIRDCCEFRLTLIHGLQLGYYDLRMVRASLQAGSGHTR